MARREYDFHAPVPPKRDDLAPAPRRELRPARTPWGLLIASSVATLAALALVVAASVIWGPATQPQALGEGSTAAPTASGEGADTTARPTTTPEPVTPGQLVPLTMNAQFTNGLTLVPPAAGDWWEMPILNRPEQFTAQSPDHSAQIEVWQTALNTSPQSDEYLSQAQLNRITDECSNAPSVMGGSEIATLVGTDGTQLELALKKALNCDGGEIWMFERLMPHSHTRLHIVLWSAHGVESNAELLAKFSEITFTVP